MNELITRTEQLPDNIIDLKRYIDVGRERINAMRAAIRAMDKVGDASANRNEMLKETQDSAELLLDYEVKVGEIMLQVPKATKGTGGNRYQRAPDREIDTAVEFSKSKADIITESGFTQRQVEHFQQLAMHPEFVAQAKAEARDEDDIVTRSDVLKKIKLVNKKNEVLEAEQAIAEQASSEFKPTLYVGDSVGYEPEEKYDLLLTDPPYSTDVDNIEEFVDSWLYNALDHVKDTGFAYIFIGAYPEEQRAYLNAKIPPHMQLTQELVWTYKNTLGNNPNDRYKLNYQVCLFYRGVNAPNLNCPLTSEQWAVQEVNAPDGRQYNRYHAWQKPMEIGERFIRHSTQPGMTVFDPFACTGTFLLAASKLGRKAYGFEINPENASIAFSRGCIRSE